MRKQIGDVGHLLILRKFHSNGAQESKLLKVGEGLVEDAAIPQASDDAFDFVHVLLIKQ